MNLMTRQAAFVPTAEDVYLLEELLGQSLDEFFKALDVADANHQIVRALILCARALSILDAVNPAALEPQLFSDALEAVQREAVAMIRDITAETSLCVAKLMQLYPAPAIVCPEKPPDSLGEFEFDFFGDPSASAANDTSFSPKAGGPEPSIEIALAIGMLSGMLRDDNARFARRIRAKQDVWNLVGELQEFRSRCCTCLQAIVTACLGGAHVNITEAALPRCKKQGIRLAQLRGALVRLESQILGHAQLLRDEPEKLDHFRRESLKLVQGYIESPAWIETPLAEKRNFVEFSARVEPIKPLTFSQLARDIEGFIRFLELSRKNIEARDIIEHDTEKLKEILGELERGGNLHDILSGATLLYGCDADFDVALRASERGMPVARQELRNLVERMLRERRGVF